MFVALMKKGAGELIGLQNWSCSSSHCLDPCAAHIVMLFLLKQNADIFMPDA